MTTTVFDGAERLECGVFTAAFGWAHGESTGLANVPSTGKAVLKDTALQTLARLPPARTTRNETHSVP